MATVERRREERRELQGPENLGGWLWQGAIGGLIAGIVFAIFEMVIAALMMGPNAFLMPLRMIGAMALGSQALNPAFPLTTAAVTGLAIHMGLSILYGVIFGAVVAFIPQLASTPTVLVVTASVYGLLLWLVNFYIIAPAAGWNWFPNQTNPVVQFVAHTFFYGTVLGLYLSQIGTARRVTAS